VIVKEKSANIVQDFYKNPDNRIYIPICVITETHYVLWRKWAKEEVISEADFNLALNLIQDILIEPHIQLIDFNDKTILLWTSNRFRKYLYERRTATTPTDLEILDLAKFSKAILTTSDRNLINKAVIENILVWNPEEE